mgnify:CR=1 FL=1
MLDYRRVVVCRSTASAWQQGSTDTPQHDNGVHDVVKLLQVGSSVCGKYKYLTRHSIFISMTYSTLQYEIHIEKEYKV